MAATHTEIEQLKETVIGCAPLSSFLRLDLLVDDSLVIEVKAVARYHPVHLAQLVTYLRRTGYPAGLLMNFNVTSLKLGVRRAEHPDRYVKQTTS